MLADGFYEVEGSDYIKFPARFEGLHRVAKLPIAPDALTFSIDSDLKIRDYAEIIYAVSGGHAFHGIITKKDDRRTSQRCEAKSMEWLLGYRYIPHYLFAAGSTLAEMFSDSSTPFQSGSVPSFGLWYLIQSNVPNGQWTAHSTTVSKLAGAGINSVLHGKTLRCSNNYPSYAADETGAATLTAAASIATMGENSFFEDADDLYIKFGDGTYGPNAHLTCADWWLDCKIRSMVTATTTSSKDMDFQGEARKKINEFVEGLGLEPEFRSSNNGYVLFSLASEISRGSSTNPLRVFIDGINCKVSIRQKSGPSCQVAVATMDNGSSAAVVDWDARPLQLIEVVDGKGEIKPLLTNRLNTLIADNLPSIEIEFPGRDFYLRIGDYVRVTSDVLGTLNLRISDIRVGLLSTRIEIGKRPFSVSKAFGDLTRPVIDPDLDILSSKAITGGTFTTRTGSFVIKNARYVAAGAGFRCYYREQFTTATTDTDLSTGAFVEVLINSVKIGPGRIKLTGTEIEIDITDYCTLPSGSDATNTFSRTIYNATGWSAGDEGIEVRQYKGKAFI